MFAYQDDAEHKRSLRDIRIRALASGGQARPSSISSTLSVIRRAAGMELLFEYDCDRSRRPRSTLRPAVRGVRPRRRCQSRPGTPRDSAGVGGPELELLRSWNATETDIPSKPGCSTCFANRQRAVPPRLRWSMG